MTPALEKFIQNNDGINLQFYLLKGRRRAKTHFRYAIYRCNDFVRKIHEYFVIDVKTADKNFKYALNISNKRDKCFTRSKPSFIKLNVLRCKNLYFNNNLPLL